MICIHFCKRYGCDNVFFSTLSPLSSSFLRITLPIYTSRKLEVCLPGKSLLYSITCLFPFLFFCRLESMHRIVLTLQFPLTFFFLLSALQEISFRIIFMCSAWFHPRRVTKLLAVRDCSYMGCRGVCFSRSSRHCVSCVGH